MRIAVFSDVHGNLSALEAVLEDIACRSVDEVVFAGDLCMVGPRPAESLRKVQGSKIVSIYGNTDDWVLGRQEPPEKLAALAKWTMAQLSESERIWLDGLAFSQRFSPTGLVEDDLLAVHANPLDVNQVIFPPEEEQMARYGRVRQRDDELAGLVAETHAAALAFGHLHIPSERTWKQLKLFNISSVSMPGDGDPRAKYGIFTWNGDAWSFERCVVEYTIRRELEAYQREQPPGWENIVQTMEAEGCFPQRV
jgi:predicted phosphodiesterase